MAAGRPLKYSDPVELNRLIDAYFESLVEPKYYKVPKKDKKNAAIPGEYEFKPVLDYNDDHVHDFKEIPSITGLALFLDTSRKTLMQYERLDDPLLSNAIKRGKDRIEYYTENSDLEPAVKIFKLKNFEWTDKQEVEHSGEVKLPDIIIKRADKE